MHMGISTYRYMQQVHDSGSQESVSGPLELQSDLLCSCWEISLGHLTALSFLNSWTMFLTPQLEVLDSYWLWFICLIGSQLTFHFAWMSILASFLLPKVYINDQNILYISLLLQSDCLRNIHPRYYFRYICYYVKRSVLK